MATTAKDTSHGKEKSRTTNQHTDVPHGRRPMKALSTGTSDKGLSIQTEKPSPHYLKPTISSNKDACKHGKPTDDTRLRLSQSRRKSIEHPPSPSQLQRTLSGGPRAARAIKLSSPPPKKAISPRPPPERSSSAKFLTERSSSAKALTPKNGKPHPLVTKPVTVKRSLSCTSSSASPSTGTPISTTAKKVNKAPRTPPNNKNISPNVDKTETLPVVKPEDDEKEKCKQIEELLEETETVSSEEVHHDEIPAPIESLIEISVQEKQDVVTLLEEKELVSDVVPVEESQEKTDQLVQNDVGKDKVIEEHTSENEECHQNPPEESKVEEDAKVTVDEGDKEGSQKEEESHKEEKGATEGNQETPRKLNFKHVKELDVKEGENEGPHKLKFKERNVEGGDGEEGKGESENVVLKKQDAHGKKEQPAYNDVIEETAKKLAEKRKSKVLALAGAFEQVISLQDSEGQQSEGDK